MTNIESRLTPIERAIARAGEQNIHAYRLAGKTFAVPSTSTPGVAWVVRFGGDGHYTCNCPGGEKGAMCKHVGSVMLLISEEADRSRQEGMRRSGLTPLREGRKGRAALFG